VQAQIDAGRQRQDFLRRQGESLMRDDLVAEDPEVPDVDAGITGDWSGQRRAEPRRERPVENQSCPDVGAQRPEADRDSTDELGQGREL
jgi:hypothetical protein